MSGKVLRLFMGAGFETNRWAGEAYLTGEFVVAMANGTSITLRPHLYKSNHTLFVLSSFLPLILPFVGCHLGRIGK